MLDQWLNEVRQSSRSSIIRGIISFIVVFLAVGVVIGAIGDFGFSSEIETLRLPIIFLTAVMIIVVLIIQAFYYRKDSIRQLENKIKLLEVALQDANDKTDSISRLMEQYKGIAQENVINRLKHLAIFAIKKEEWKAKGARIERFRIDTTTIDHQNQDFIVLDRIAVLINLGTKDQVAEGMIFSVQDPTDGMAYGTIVVKTTHNGGSSCKIVSPDHAAFWHDILTTSRENKVKIVTALPNIIEPFSPIKDMQTRNARQLLQWLQNIEEAQLD